MAEPQRPQLTRVLGLPQATVLNMIDMVGIGPFTALPIILLAFPGKFSLIPWLIGALASLFDAFIWSELGAAWPEAGGSYIFLQKLYKGKLGKILAFLYAFQTSLHLPLVMTSAALGFLNYLRYLHPLTYIQGKYTMLGLVAIIMVLLYRNIVNVGKIGMVFSLIVVTMLLWTIVTGALNFDSAILEKNSIMPVALGNVWSSAFWFLIGTSTSKTVYAYLGYYNVCHLGGEIKNPQRNIPISIILSVILITLLYVAMQFTVAGAVPAEKIGDENVPLVAILFENFYGKNIAMLATVLLLLVCISSLFALLLGYTRIIYAAARDGMHFRFLAHLHPTKNFPDYALLLFSSIAMIFCLVFDKPSDVFRFIVVTRIFIQFIPQAIGVYLLRIHNRIHELPFRIPIFPLPIVISVVLWLFLFFTTGYKFALGGGVVIGVGVLCYYFLIGRGTDKLL
ncbi:MAG: APC family permease [Chitinophagales bacterium]